MKRIAIIAKMRPGMKDELLKRMEKPWDELNAAMKNCGISNASAWYVEDMVYAYYEQNEAQCAPADTAVLSRFCDYMGDCVTLIGKEDDLRLMYHDIGIVREDKSLIRHRVFATVLKDGCADEYKARHDKLVEARGDKVSEGPESNFTIWCTNSKYIFGYCELVKSFDHEMTEEEKKSTIAWETRQFEIMDWLTDDVDWISGEKHEHIKNLFMQK